MAGSRRRAREVALQILYQLDANPELGAAEALGLYFRELAAGPAEEGVSTEAFDRPFAESLVRGVHAHRATIDELLGKVSRNWRLERMARLDRNILRMAVFELSHLKEIPVEVVLNEAVDLAKRFGSAEAPAFVNGVLDSAVAAGARPR